MIYWCIWNLKYTSLLYWFIGPSKSTKYNVQKNPHHIAKITKKLKCQIFARTTFYNRSLPRNIIILQWLEIIHEKICKINGGKIILFFAIEKGVASGYVFLVFFADIFSDQQRCFRNSHRYFRNYHKTLQQMRVILFCYCVAYKNIRSEGQGTLLAG